MSFTVPMLAVAAMAVLALVACERKYRLTSANLVFMTGALAAWFAVSYLLFGR